MLLAFYLIIKVLILSNDFISTVKIVSLEEAPVPTPLKGNYIAK